MTELVIGLGGIAVLLGVLIAWSQRREQRLREIRDVLIEIRDAWRS